MNGSPKTAVQRVTDAVRYWSERLGGGAPLPSQEELAEQFGVSRDTVQKALKLLQEEGLVDSIRGSGTFVAGAAPDSGPDQEEMGPAIVALGHHLDHGLRAQHVSIDYFGFTAETLASELKPRLVRMRLPGWTAPESLRIRLIVPDLDRLAVPFTVADPEDPRPLERLRGIADRCLDALTQAVDELRDTITDIGIEVRTTSMTPQVKLYVINGEVALRGWYVVHESPVKLPRTDGTGTEIVPIYDLRGLEAPLILQLPSASEQGREWFESVWSTIARPSTLSE